MFWKKQKKQSEIEMENLRASGKVGGEGTMDDAVLKIGRIMMEKGMNDESEIEIAAILESEVRCAKCSAKFKLVTGWKKDPKMLVKIACPYCNCDAGIKLA